MNAWDVYTYDPGFGDHPAVIISAGLRVTNKPSVEILLCSSRPPQRKPAAHEVMLDMADGLDWETLCKCDLIMAIPKENLSAKRGTVCLERRRQIVRAIIASHGWNLL